MIEPKTIKVESVINAGVGVIVVRITVYDEHGNPLSHQPPGRFQVWQVIGSIRLLKPCNSAAEANSWLKQEANNMFRELDEGEAFNTEDLEAALVANRVKDAHEALDCNVDLIVVENGAEELCRAQLQQRHRKCKVEGYPKLLKGLEPDYSLPTTEGESVKFPPTPTPRGRRPG